MDNSQNVEGEESKVDIGAGIEILPPTEDSDDVEFESYNDDISPSGILSPQDKIKRLREKLAEAQRAKQEYLDGWQRLKADYINLKKRSEEEKSELGNYVRESVVADLIPVLESFDMAFANKDAWEKVDPNWRMGVEYIHKQFMETLQNYGLSEVSPLGEVFDPQHSTAIGNVHTDDQNLDHKVAEVVQKGYKMGDRLIKSPKVKVYVTQN
ncbi:MAG TPA: nucleotide exchange factor GrpE [Candidatus Paceibacterota bacterium]|nr:nucleotide exchange factor GrpE [Candidatus Paceibacterota bacterium]